MPLVNGRFVADMKSPRTPDNEEPAAERACDFRPVDKGFTEEMALAEAERCASHPRLLRSCANADGKSRWLLLIVRTIRASLLPRRRTSGSEFLAAMGISLTSPLRLGNEAGQ